MTETIELPRTGGPGSGLGDNWRVIVRNDDHNTFDHVALEVVVVVEQRVLLEAVRVVEEARDPPRRRAVAQADRGDLLQRGLERVGAEAGRVPGDDEAGLHQAPTSARIAPGPSAVRP